MTLNARTPQNGSETSPLFRPEAMLYQQQKSYGEIIIIRPLSLTLLTWLSIAIVAGLLALCVFGHYTDKAHLEGRLLAPQTTAGGEAPRAKLAVPARWLPLVQPGTRLLLRCRACAAPQALSGTVLGISGTPMEAADRNSEAGDGNSQIYEVMVSLPPQAAQATQPSPSRPGTRVEAEIPVGRKPLIKWFFERSGS